MYLLARNTQRETLWSLSKVQTSLVRKLLIVWCKSARTSLFRINAITDEHRNEADYEKIVLTPTFSVPRILSHTVEQESCHQSGDAAIRVTFDRSLHPGEALALFQQGGAGRNIESLDATNSFLIPNLSAGSYSFNIKGTHSNGLSSYSNQTSHQFTAQVVERPAISYSLAHRDVSCLAGQDGTVTVTASGGTGNYSASLYKDDGALLETKSFSSGGTTFGRLPSGSYSVRIKDSNNCLARTTSGDEQIQRVTLAEPSEAVAIELLKTVRPLAHNSAMVPLRLPFQEVHPQPRAIAFALSVRRITNLSHLLPYDKMATSISIRSPALAEENIPPSLKTIVIALSKRVIRRHLVVARQS